MSRTPRPVFEPKLDKVVEETEEMMAIQTVIKPKDELLKRIFRRGWTMASSGNPFIIMPASQNYLNPHLVYSRQEWPLRSTAIQKEDFTWELVEFCSQYYISDNVDSEIEECTKPTMVLTMLHKRDEPLDVLGVVGEQEMVSIGGADIDASSFTFPAEPNIPAEMMETHKPEELAQVDPQGIRDGPAPTFEWEFSNKDTLVVNDEPLTANSSIGFLRAAAEYLGISKNGTKQQLWSRLNQKVQTLEHEQTFLDSNRLYKDEQWSKGLIGQSVPRTPSPEEVALHELSHLPYRDWCPYCVSCKGKQDPQRPVEFSPDDRRSIPSIEIDYCFSKVEEAEPVSTVLVAIDCQTKMLFSMPLASKGQNLRGQAEQLVRFTMTLNHMDQVELVSDAEPTMKSLLASVQLLRQHLGYPTTITHARPGDKGRTSQIERAIQTLRKQSSTLVQMASERCQLQLPGDHAIWPWSFLHATWLLNRFHNHAATKTSPFELVHGRRYAGKVASFGEVVLVLHRRGPNTKSGPQWVPGVWLTKTDGDDQHVVSTPEGLLKGKAIRRLSDPWRSTWLFMVKERPYAKLTRKATLKNLRFGAPPTPKPVTEKQVELPYEPIDYDAQDVIEYARTHPPSPASDAGMPTTDEYKRGSSGDEPSAQKFAKLLDTAESAGDGDLVDDTAVHEPEPKMPRTSPEGSPSATSSRLFAPHFAGNIQHVMEVGEIDDEQWEDEVVEYMDSDVMVLGGDVGQEEPVDEGKPPELSPDELSALDEAAGYEEIRRLLEMGVIDEPSQDDLDQGTILSTRSVMDWRFRDQKWQRRCRFVAREFRAGDRSTAATFAPTSGAGARLVMVAHCCYNWLLAFLDIKDAFLLVPQREKILVAKPDWWADETGSRYWVLSKCLPGQRNAASRFFDFLHDHLQSLGMVNTPLLPSLFKHKEKELALCSHVDDLVVGGEKQAVEWLVSELKAKFTLQGGNLVPSEDQDDHEAVRFLKKRHFFTQAGVIISPHEKYAEELVALYGLQHRKAKTTPDVSGEIFDSPELDEAGQHRFRSAMGTLLYLSQDRIDLQHSVRHLSQYMSRPTLAAEAAVKHVILYLKGTPDLGIMLGYGMSNKSKLSEIHGKADPEELTKDLVEVFTDADWAGDKSSGVRRRHSVSSAIVYVNGKLITAWSRTQKSIALSSCESEYLASVGGGAEALFIAALWEFLTGKATEAHIVSDSSSCRAFAQRQGVGRLKHINVKYLWLQQKIKECALQMDGVPTALNVADLGTKRLSRARRAFLMFLIGLVEYDPNIKGYTPCGEDEFNQYIQKKALGKTMKSVRQVMVNSLVSNDAELPIRISKPLVKAMTIMALQPVVNGARIDEVEGLVIQNYNLVEIFFTFPWFMFFYALVFLLVGVFLGLHLKKVAHKIELTKVLHWACDAVEDAMKKKGKEIAFVDDWDPERHELRQYRVLASVDDAESGEEYFRECPGGLARFVKLDRKRRIKYGYKETDPLNAMDLSSGEEAEEEDMEVDEPDEPMEAVASASARIAHGEMYGPESVTTAPVGDGPRPSSHGGDQPRSESNTVEYLSMPGSPPTDLEPPPLPVVGVDWDNLDEIFRHFPPHQSERAKRVQQVGLFSERLFVEFMKIHLMELFPNQPDIIWDYEAWWTQRERRYFLVFRDIVVHGMHQGNWGTFVEQWFIQQDYEDNVPSNMSWDDD
eukprot:s1787_g6.t1